MRIALLAFGTRGDVQPLLLLAQALVRAGHKVRFGCQKLFRTWVEAEGLEFWPVAGDSRQALDDPDGQTLFAPPHPVAFYRSFQRLMGPLMAALLDDALTLCRDCDLLLYGMGAFVAPYAAEALGIPSVPIVLLPVSRSRERPAELVTSRSLGSWLNLATHHLVEQSIWQPLRPIANRLRREVLGLPPLPRFGSLDEYYAGRRPMLCGYSPSVCPKPADWPTWHEVTGYWLPTLATPYTPDPALAAFLAAGPRPVYIGFGSMRDKEPVALTKAVLNYAARGAQRIILHRGWAGLGGQPLPPHVFELGEVPHHWLFQQVATVVHHGGAGTTAAALQAGVPSIVVPFGLDQPFWAHRLQALGAGLTLQRRHLNEYSLASALAKVQATPSMAAAAQGLSAAISSENGLANAVRFVDTLARRRA